MQHDLHMLTDTAIPEDAGKKTPPPPDYLKIVKAIKEQRDQVLLAVTITPELARIILDNHNLRNRPIAANKIKDYTAEIKTGRWRLNGEFISFSKSGVMLNGQHRCLSCIAANTAFATDLRFNLEDDVFDVIDRGKNRDAGDILAIAGFVNPQRFARAIRWAYTIDQGAPTPRGNELQPEDVLILARGRYGDADKFLHEAQAIYRLCGQPEAMVAGFLYVASKHNAAKAQEFADAWKSNQWGGRYAAIGVMQKCLGIMKNRQQLPKPMHRVVMMINCWNAFLRGRSGYQTTYLEWDGQTIPVIKSRGYAQED